MVSSLLEIVCSGVISTPSVGISLIELVADPGNKCWVEWLDVIELLFRGTCLLCLRCDFSIICLSLALNE